MEHVLSNKINICTVTEIWLKPADDAIRQGSQPIGYLFIDYPSPSGSGLLCESNLTLSLVRSGENKSVEFSEWLINCPFLSISLIGVYRPANSKKYAISPAVFHEEFDEYLQGVILSKEPLLITWGCSDKDAAKFKDLLVEFGLKQHATVPTHIDGHVLDLFIARMNDNTALMMSQLQATTYMNTHL